MEGIEKQHHQLLTVRRGAMLQDLFERVMLKRVKVVESCPTLQRLRAVFFPEGGYRTDVSCQQFSDALNG